MDKIIGFFVNKYTHKGLKVAINYLASAQIASFLAQYGVTLDHTQLQIALMALLEAGRSRLKQQTKWGWL